MNSYKYSFISTQEDLLDAFEADWRRRTGIGRVIRWGVCGVGLMFVTIGVWAIGSISPPWRPLLWLTIGVIILWALNIRPALKRIKIRKNNVSRQPVSLCFDESGIYSNIDGVGEFKRKWEELIYTYTIKRGILIYFSDGIVNWLPSRVFSGKKEYEDIIDLFKEKIEENELLKGNE